MHEIYRITCNLCETHRFNFATLKLARASLLQLRCCALFSSTTSCALKQVVVNDAHEIETPTPRIESRACAMSRSSCGAIMCAGGIRRCFSWVLNSVDTLKSAVNFCGKFKRRRFLSNLHIFTFCDSKTDLIKFFIVYSPRTFHGLSSGDLFVNGDGLGQICSLH